MQLFLLMIAVSGPADEWAPGFGSRLAPYVHITDECVTLRNRGILVSKKMYDEVAISFTWKWTEGDEAGKYQDHLCVVFGTDGEQRPAWSHEIDHGTLVRLNPGSGGITVELWQTAAREARQLGSKDGFTFARGMEYDVRMVVKDGKLTVFVDGTEAVTVDLPKEYQRGRVAIYDRESVAGVVKESQLTKLAIE